MTGHPLKKSGKSLWEENFGDGNLDIQQENFRGIHSHWRSFSFVYNHYLFLACFLVVLLSILLYLLRLRRIHPPLLPSSSSPSLWIQEGLPPQKIPGN
ncbi:Ectonucleoside triphosphate diphosphohydrolase 7, partial [Lamprotornis superbus]